MGQGTEMWKSYAKTFKAAMPHINCHGTVLSACKTMLNPTNWEAQLQIEAMGFCCHSFKPHFLAIMSQTRRSPTWVVSLTKQLQESEEVTGELIILQYLLSCGEGRGWMWPCPGALPLAPTSNNLHIQLAASCTQNRTKAQPPSFYLKLLGSCAWQIDELFLYQKRTGQSENSDFSLLTAAAWVGNILQKPKGWDILPHYLVLCILMNSVFYIC